MMTLRRPIAVAVLALTLAACGDPEGPTLSAPDRGLVGAWVRTVSPEPPNPAGITPVTPDDTIFFYPDRGGLWSREFLAEIGGQLTTIRRCERLRVTADSPRLLVTLFGDPMLPTSYECPAVGGLRMAGDVALPALPGSPRRLTMAPGPHWEILRQGRDRLLVRTLGGEFVVTEWYRRADSQLVY